MSPQRRPYIQTRTGRTLHRKSWRLRSLLSSLFYRTTSSAWSRHARRPGKGLHALGRSFGPIHTIWQHRKRRCIVRAVSSPSMPGPAVRARITCWSLPPEFEGWAMARLLYKRLMISNHELNGKTTQYCIPTQTYKKRKCQAPKFPERN